MIWYCMKCHCKRDEGLPRKNGIVRCPFCDHDQWIQDKPAVKGRKDDSGKLRYSLLPLGVEELHLKVLEHGAKEYEVEGWKHVENARTRYYDALRRHTKDWWEKGERYDKKSGLPHLAHIIANASFLLWFEENDV